MSGHCPHGDWPVCEVCSLRAKAENIQAEMLSRLAEQSEYAGRAISKEKALRLAAEAVSEGLKKEVAAWEARLMEERRDTLRALMAYGQEVEQLTLARDHFMDMAHANLQRAEAAEKSREAGATPLASNAESGCWECDPSSYDKPPGAT